MKIPTTLGLSFLTVLLTLAILISLFGPQIIELFGAAVRGHLGITLTVLGVLIVAAAIFWLWRGKQRRSTPQATD